MIKTIIGDHLESNVFIYEKEDSCIIIDCGASLEKIKNWPVPCRGKTEYRPGRCHNKWRNPSINCSGMRHLYRKSVALFVEMATPRPLRT